MQTKRRMIEKENEKQKESIMDINNKKCKNVIDSKSRSVYAGKNGDGKKDIDIIVTAFESMK